MLPNTRQLDTGRSLGRHSHGEVWACKNCTYVQAVIPNVHLCLMCEHSQSSFSTSQGGISPPCEPEECQDFPIDVGVDYLKKYYRYNLTRFIAPELGVPADMVNFIVHFVEGGYNVGDTLEAVDSMSKWYFATVVEVKDDQVKVHYEGQPSKWDEYLPTGSERIAPVLTHTIGKPHQ
jgi:hypothetical protein